MIKNQGRWGVTHAQPPTESRSGHGALIGGFYKDPSAATRGRICYSSFSPVSQLYCLYISNSYWPLVSSAEEVLLCL